MGNSIVKVPKHRADYDFIAFSFMGEHSYEDYGIYRVSSGNRYSENLAPTFTDKTVEVPGSAGLYYFGTTYKQRDFNIDFAFEKMPEATYNKMRKWLNGKQLGELWFAEAPYKVYTAKITKSAVIKSLCFEKENERFYNGEGSVTFTAYYPYAHSPDCVVLQDGTELNGNYYTSYSQFYNYEQIKEQLPNYSNTACGDLPFHFVAYLDDIKYSGEDRGSKIKVGTGDTLGIEFESSTDSGIKTEG